MTGTQYNNIIQWTLANNPPDETMDSALVAKAIFNNCGVAFPTGNNLDILLTLMSEDYMGWTSCTFAQAQEFANAGVAAVGIDAGRVVVIIPDTTAAILDSSVVETPDALFAHQSGDMAISERMEMQFFAYLAATVQPPPPPSSKTLNMPVNTNQKYSGNPNWIKNYGCAVCCEADVASYYDSTKNYSIQDMINCGAGSESQGAIWSKTPKATFTYYNSGEYYAKIKSEIDANRPVVVFCTGGSYQHYVVAYKYVNNGSTNGDISVLDPANTTASTEGARRTLAESMNYNSVTTINSLMLTAAK